MKADTGVRLYVGAATVCLRIATGDGLLPRPLANDKFPDWNPKASIDYIVE